MISKTKVLGSFFSESIGFLLGVKTTCKKDVLVKSLITTVFFNKLLRIKLHLFPLKNKSLSETKEEYLLCKAQPS